MIHTRPRRTVKNIDRFNFQSVVKCKLSQPIRNQLYGTLPISENNTIDTNISDDVSDTLQPNEIIPFTSLPTDSNFMCNDIAKWCESELFSSEYQQINNYSDQCDTIGRPSPPLPKLEPQTQYLYQDHDTIKIEPPAQSNPSTEVPTIIDNPPQDNKMTEASEASTVFNSSSENKHQAVQNDDIVHIPRAALDEFFRIVNIRFAKRDKKILDLKNQLACRI